MIAATSKLGIEFRSRQIYEYRESASLQIQCPEKREVHKAANLNANIRAR